MRHSASRPAMLGTFDSSGHGNSQFGSLDPVGDADVAVLGYEVDHQSFAVSQI
jgi:hypothetical protein